MRLKQLKLHSLYSYRYTKNVLKWAIFSLITGVVCGLIGTVFHHLVETATELRTKNDNLIFLAPFIGLLITLLYRKSHMTNDGGTNTVISSIRSSEKIPFKMTPLIFISTILTHLCGGSSGREGAALQIGGSMGSYIGNLLKLEEKDLHIITMCGMSAVFAALFGTPITATVFSMEVISVGVMYYVAFIPCISSSIIAYLIAGKFGMVPVRFSLTHLPGITISSLLQVGCLAALCAGLSILFCITIHRITHLYQFFCPNQYLRSFMGGCLIILCTILWGCHDYNGAGMNIIEDAIAGTAKPEAFFIKMLFTAITLGAGFKGGEIVPTFFIGSTFGNVAGKLLGLSPSFGAAIGLISLFCGVVNCPIASLLLSIELFGSEGLILFTLACAVSYTLSGYYGLYSSQKIVYSKLHPTYINRNTQ